MNIKGLLKTAKLFCHNNAPDILTVTSCIGLGVTVYNAIQDTRKAMTICRREKPESLKEELQLTLPCYIPTGLSVVLTAGSIIGARNAGASQMKDMTLKYLGSQAFIQEYQKKVIDRIGVKKERQVYDEAITEVANKERPVISDMGVVDTIIETGHGNTLFYDKEARIYFRSDINFLKNQANKLNADVLGGEDYYDWNEIIYRWDLLDRVKLSYPEDRLITTSHLFEPRFTPQIMENGQYLTIISYDLYPASEYFKR